MYRKKICKESIKTDPNITALTVCNKKHSGEHPVTMRLGLRPTLLHLLPPASDSPPACSTPGPDPALSATPSRSSASIGSPAGETTAESDPCRCNKTDYYKLTRSAYVCRLVGSL
ncbi:hypothetical protein J6590_085759 [Homalodisca vitripennis]|nr:hypothetical protein J6590_085759 [Homalodisca vitripennis]